MRKYLIRRPPLLTSFELPEREELLRLKIGDWIKLFFVEPNGQGGERMWVIITKMDKNGEAWEGKLNNDPVTLRMKYGEKISFHPLDIIDWTKEKIKSEK